VPLRLYHPQAAAERKAPPPVLVYFHGGGWVIGDLDTHDTLCRQLAAWDFDLVDCQVHTEHLARFGATDWPRDRFLEALSRSLTRETRRGRWRLEVRLDPDEERCEWRQAKP